MAIKKKTAKKTVTVTARPSKDGEEHNVQIQDDTGQILKQTGIPAFHEYPNTLTYKGKSYRFWGREVVGDEAILVYRPGFDYEVK